MKKLLLTLSSVFLIACGESNQLATNEPALIPCSEAESKLMQIVTDPDTTFGTGSNRADEIKTLEQRIRECNDK